MYEKHRTTHPVVVLIVSLVRSLLVVDGSSLLMSSGFGLPGHVVNHLLSMLFLAMLKESVSLGL